MSAKKNFGDSVANFFGLSRKSGVDPPNQVSVNPQSAADTLTDGGRRRVANPDGTRYGNDGPTNTSTSTRGDDPEIPNNGSRTDVNTPPKTKEQLEADAIQTQRKIDEDAELNAGRAETPDSLKMKVLKYTAAGITLGSLGLAVSVALDKYLKKNGKEYNIIAIESVKDTLDSSNNNIKDISNNIIIDSSGNLIKKDTSGNLIKDIKGNNIKGLTGYKTLFVIDSQENFSKNGTAEIHETNCNPNITKSTYYIDSVISGKKLIIKTDEKVIEKGTTGRITYYTDLDTELAQAIDEFVNGPLDEREEDGSSNNNSLFGGVGKSIKDILKSVGLDGISTDTINYIIFGVGGVFILLVLFSIYKMFK
jgi:hypothetical protein